MSEKHQWASDRHQRIARKKLSVAVGLAAAVIGVGIVGAPIAGAVSGTNTSATPGTPGDMQISVSPDEKVDSDGTQGSFTNAVQGTKDSDGDQDAFETNSSEAVPQDKPHSKS